MRVFVRAPDAIVGTVEDAHQPLLAFAQQAFQPAAEFCCENLARVGRADRGQPVGVHQPALHKGELAVEFQGVHVPETLRQIQRGEGVPVEQTLVGEVVNGEHRGRALSFQRQQGGHQAGLPVMAMHQLRPPVDAGAALGDFGDGAAEQREARGVIGPVLAIGAGIGPAGPVEVAGGIDNVEDGLAVGQEALQQTHRRTGARYLEFTDQRELAGAGHHLPVTGQDHAHIMAQALQFQGQTAGDIAQAPGLDQGMRLTGGEQDFHAGSLQGVMTACSGTNPA